MNEPFEHGGTGYEELDWRLRTYAAARLDPSPDASRRMRRAVVARAADLAAIQAYEARRLVDQEAERRRSWHRGVFSWLQVPTHRRGAAAFLALSMTFGGTMGVLAATPGSPLYGARIWLENAFLPSQIDARAAARVDNLEQRVEDAEHAAGADDPFGVAEALAAYEAEIQQALADANGDPTALANLHAALDVHTLLLQQLAADAPSGAQNAIHQAINASRQAAQSIAHANGGTGGNAGNGGTPPTPPTAPTAPPAPAATPSGNGGNGGSGGGGSGGNGPQGSTTSNR
ncbi:MAG TPA: hypothetical protein VKR30_05665 [Candidatus Limnocylindrales bacterium]|nr:hypothetical protein [Candidatus Limnocylindrales bacterium]